MERKAASVIMLTLLLVGMLTLAFNIRPVKASGTVYIRANGSIDPPTAPISTIDDVTYAFTDNIYDQIVVERDNIVVDGAGHSLQGTGALGSEGIALSRRSNVTIKNMEIKAFSLGILLDSCSNINVVGNNVTANNWSGIVLWWSSNNYIAENNVTENKGHGIHLFSSSNCNSIFRNNVKNNWHGISPEWSSNNTLRSNNMDGNDINFWLDGLSLSHFVHDIDASNTVDGKPVYYWVNEKDRVIPLDAGYVALVNCTRITAHNLNLTKNGQGILLAATTDSTITKNHLANNVHGIRFIGSSNNYVAGNNITANIGNGIWLHSSLNNSIVGNDITANNVYGIVLVGGSSNNSIFHNNLVNNTVQVSTYNLVNVWDDGYPSGGNYWSDYIGVDLYGGLYQNETGSDGIGDTPYTIDENNQDRYPLMNPWSLTPDINNDGVVNTNDIIILADAFGSQIGDLNWNLNVDLVADNVVDIFDAVVIAVNFGKTYP